VFDALWTQWPAVSRKRHPQQKVRDAIANQLKLGADPDRIIQAGRAHVAERLPKGAEFVKGLVPWLNGGLWQNWASEAEPFDRDKWLQRYFDSRGDYRHPLLTDADIANALKAQGAKP
jgi:hypothetical protein